jgi:hypothetical protein
MLEEKFLNISAQVEEKYFLISKSSVTVNSSVENKLYVIFIIYLKWNT